MSGSTLDMRKNNIEAAYYASKIGKLTIYADMTGITKIAGAESSADDLGLIEDGKELATGAATKTDNPHIKACISWLEQYFDDPSKLPYIEEPSLNMNAHKNKPFLVKAWQCLQKSTNPGEMISYGKLAALAGNSKAGRAAGLAMQRNPFPIIVPCHRVIRANAKIGNYSLFNGAATKKWLLDHEKKNCKQTSDKDGSISSAVSELNELQDLIAQ